MNSLLLYHDRDIAAAVKPFGVLSEHHPKDGMPDRIALLLNRSPESVYPVHRLDRDAGGVMVYALNPGAAAILSQAVSERRIRKQYLAVVEGRPEENDSVWRDYLFYDSRRRKSFRVDRQRKGVREAVLRQQLLETVDALSLLAIHLETGRTHQIRCQCASRGLPIAGDRRYGGHYPCEGIGLWSVEIAFSHPSGSKPMVFQAPPPLMQPWTRFSFLTPKHE